MIAGYDIHLDLISGPSVVWLFRQGVRAPLLASLLPIYTARGSRGADGCFDPDPAGKAFIVFESCDDLIFWQPNSGDIATWHGRAFALGEGIIDDASTYALDGALNIFSSPLQWLRADCDGVVVLDWRFAFDRLRDCPRIAVDEKILPTYRKWMKPPRMPSVSVIVHEERIAA